MLSENRIAIGVFFSIVIVPFLIFSAVSCQINPVEGVPLPVATSEQAESQTVVAIDTPTTTSQPIEKFDKPPTMTAFPTSTSTPLPTALPTETALPTPTPIGSCQDRDPGQDMLALITLEYGISKKYAPPDLIEISTTLPVTVTLGYPTQIRQIALEPLTQMVNAMLEAGLQPQIISGYRSYSSQTIAWNKWAEKMPDRVAIISSPPGHSEHQLGTTVDFGSPELPEIVGEEDIEFHTYFYKTSEGQWLAEHAHKYGFTLSYTRETFELTGLFYEPWHFRYVGQELATYLKESNQSLIQYLLASHGPPCMS